MTTDLPPNVLGGGPTRQRYLVGNAPPVALGDLARSLQEEPDVEVVKTIGPPERPSVLVVSMTEDAADRLRKQFPGLIVEADAPLFPSQPGTDTGTLQQGPFQTGPLEPGSIQPGTLQTGPLPGTLPGTLPGSMPGTPDQGAVQPGTSQPGTGQPDESQPGAGRQGPGQLRPS